MIVTIHILVSTRIPSNPKEWQAGVRLFRMQEQLCDAIEQLLNRIDEMRGTQEFSSLAQF